MGFRAMKANRRWFNRWIVLALLLAACIVCVGTLHFLFAPPMTATSLKQQINQDLPRGSTRTEVESWLNSRGIRFGTMQSAKRAFEGIGAEIPFRYLPGLFFIEFKFDDCDRLTNVSVQEIHLVP
jgi:hypothetical protein